MDLRIEVAHVAATDPDVVPLLQALTAELATGGYTADQTFGYSADQLVRSGVHLVGARVGGRAVGVGGVELQGDGVAELKRFYVAPDHRGTGVADAIMAALLAQAEADDVRQVRLETGDQQHAALAFYRRHGFVRVPPFAPYESSATSVCLQRTLTGERPRDHR
jgi:putative acetyltransferase